MTVATIPTFEVCKFLHRSRNKIYNYQIQHWSFSKLRVNLELKLSVQATMKSEKAYSLSIVFLTKQINNNPPKKSKLHLIFIYCNTFQVIKRYMQIFINYIHVSCVLNSYLLATYTVYGCHCYICEVCVCECMLYFILILPFKHICIKIRPRT